MPKDIKSKEIIKTVKEHTVTNVRNKVGEVGIKTTDTAKNKVEEQFKSVNRQSDSQKPETYATDEVTEKAKTAAEVTGEKTERVVKKSVKTIRDKRAEKKAQAKNELDEPLLNPESDNNQQGKRTQDAQKQAQENKKKKDIKEKEPQAAKGRGSDSVSASETEKSEKKKPKPKQRQRQEIKTRNKQNIKNTDNNRKTVKQINSDAKKVKEARRSAESTGRTIKTAEKIIDGSDYVKDVLEAWDYWLTAINKQLSTSTHEHTYSENWSCDPYYHWHNATCVHTGLTSDFGEHTFDENGKCTVCGYEKKTDALTEAKTAAKTEIDKLIKDADDDVKAIGTTAKTKIDKLTTITAVTEKLTAAIAEINGIKTEKAKTAAIAELEKATETVVSVQSKAIAKKAKALIEKAESEYEVTGILEKALEQIKAEEESAEFATEKSAAIKAVDELVESVPAETQKLSSYTDMLAKVKNYINASTTEKEVNERKAIALKALNEFIPETDVEIKVDETKGATIVSRELVPSKSTKYEVVTVRIKEADGINENGDWFVYWKDDKGNIVSTYSTYQFFAVENRTLTPVYVSSDKYDEERAKAVIVTDIVRTTDNKDGTVTLFAEHSASKAAVGNAILQHGIIYATDAEQKNNLTLENELVKKASANTSNTALTGLLRTTVDAEGADKVYARTYLVDAKGNAIYGKVETVTVTGTASTQSVAANTVESVAEQSEEIIPTAKETAPTFMSFLMNIINTIIAFVKEIIALF